MRTASELAGVVGLTPSATSYHLRALERWGILVRAEGGGDGRERPWRAAARNLRWEDEEVRGESQRAARRVIAGSYLQRLADQLDAWASADPQDRAAWHDTANISRGYLWLTADEARAFAEAHHELLDRFSSGRDARNHPPGTRRFAHFLAVVPLVEASGEEPRSGPPAG